MHISAAIKIFGLGQPPFLKTAAILDPGEGKGSAAGQIASNTVRNNCAKFRACITKCTIVLLTAATISQYRNNEIRVSCKCYFKQALLLENLGLYG